MIQYKKITLLVNELLYKHDCVIVPNLGGFVARNFSSNFSKGNNILFPPSKQVLFNKNLIHNDGLLVAALMEKNAIAFDEATRNIEDYRNYIQALLHAKKRFELDQLGLLYLDAENNLRFEAKVDVNFLFDSFGFEPVVANLLPVVPETKIIPPAFVDRKATVDPVKMPKKPYAKMAALAIGIPAVLAFVLLAAYSKPMQPLMQSSFNPFYIAQKTYHPKPVIKHQPYFINDPTQPALLADANGYATFTLNQNGTVLTANINDTVAKIDKTLVHKPVYSVSNKSLNGSFQVVVGCFGIKENADHLVADLLKKRIKGGISGVNAKGLHIVSCGGFETKQDAIALLETIRNAYPNAWIMAK